MALPKYFAGADTVDTQTTLGNCVYPPTPLGVTTPAPSVIVGSGPLLMVTPGPVAPVPPINTSPINLPICPAGVRSVVGGTNTFLCIEGKFPALTAGIGAGGDVATLAQGGGNRRLTIPFQHPTIVIGSGGSYVPPSNSE